MTQPFTAAGADAKFSELYALTDIELQAEVDLIRADLRSWLTSNFELDTAQQAYLYAMDNDFIDVTASQLAFVVPRRIDVNLEIPDTPPDYASKLVRTQANITFNPDLPNWDGSSLQFEIVYVD